VLCSEKPDFEYARQGIILGAFDYFVKPFDESLFFSMFNRIKNEVFESEASGIYYTGELSVFFENRDKGIYSYISTMLDELYKSDDDLIKLDRKVGHICKSVFDEIFGNNEWFDLYVVQQDFYGAENVAEDNKESRKNYYRDALCNLFDEYCELYPYVNNNKIREVILYILNNPENNLKQKNIAAEMYINSSYLSTVFPAQTGMRFVDYLNRVKLKRAAFLLKETNMKIVDIATRLDYKDIGYFSRLFKSKFNVTPSEYRIPDEYDFQI
jgi:two-component system response regulator YesN